MDGQAWMRESIHSIATYGPPCMGRVPTRVRVCVVLVRGVLVGGRYKNSVANHEALVSTPWNFKIFSNS